MFWRQENQRTPLRQVDYDLLEGQAEDQCGLRSQGGGQDEDTRPGPRPPPHLAHVVLTHGRDGPEHELLAADALERLLHFTQELLELEESV